MMVKVDTSDLLSPVFGNYLAVRLRPLGLHVSGLAQLFFCSFFRTFIKAGQQETISVLSGRTRLLVTYRKSFNLTSGESRLVIFVIYSRSWAANYPFYSISLILVPH